MTFRTLKKELIIPTDRVPEVGEFVEIVPGEYVKIKFLGELVYTEKGLTLDTTLYPNVFNSNHCMEVRLVRNDWVWVDVSHINT